MLLKREWAERFIQACAKVETSRRHSFADGRLIYAAASKGTCWVTAAGYVRLVDPRSDGSQFVRLILGRGGLFGDRPFGEAAYRGFISPQPENAVAHGRAEVLEISRAALESASQSRPELAALLLESATSRVQFLERRLMWQFTNPIRARLAAALRDLICFDGQRCRHGHTIDVRLTHQELAEIVGAARPVISAELVKMRSEGLVQYTRSFFCVDDLAGLDRVAAGPDRNADA